MNSKKLLCVTLLAVLLGLTATPGHSQVNSYVVLSKRQVDSLIKLRTDPVRSVDLHIHTTMKNYAANVESPAWLDQHISDAAINVANWSGVNADPDDQFNNFKSYRQADFGILSTSHASILVSSISPIEKHLLTKKWPEWWLPMSLRRINHKVTGLPMSKLRMLYKEENSSNRVFRSELQFLLAQNPTNPGYPGFTVSVAVDKQDLMRKYAAGETALVVGVEGGHIFQGDIISRRHSYDSMTFNSNEQAEILANVDALKNLPVRVFFVTLGHFSWNGLVGSPKTLDMDDTKRKLLRKFSHDRNFRSELFLKYGEGVMGTIERPLPTTDVHPTDSNYCICQTIPGAPIATGDIGWQVIERLLDRSGKYGAPVLIDVKHMDIKARLQYYRYLKTRKDSIPIIASHIAVSGKDTATAKQTGLCPVYDVYEEVENTQAYYQGQFSVPAGAHRAPCLSCRDVDVNQINWFYPWGINLATEEIPIIYESDGIIGLALEERVLGTNRPNYNEERFRSRFHQYTKQAGITDGDDTTFFAMLPFFKNLFFIVSHSGRTDQSAWDHIALGSDFDGIAKPVRFCKTAANLPNFHSLLVRFLPHYIAFDHCETLMYGLTPQQIADKIVFENGERFILKYF